MNRKFLSIVAVLVCVFLTSFAMQAASVMPPEPQREFRGTWIASVGNIDWPSKPGLTSSQQKLELVEILDRAVQLRLNAVILQVRPACDALYSSKIEPWSEYLSGEMGKPPQVLYDPLAFAVEQAHLRGLELHAWFNPFRARHVGAKSPIAATHISRTRPDLVRSYAKYIWLDPGESAAREYSTAVILDVLRRYDIDGVHLDDYFYPYKEKDASGKWMEFPDEPSWRRYVAAGGRLERGDWRRKNVDDFVNTLYSRIRAEKSWVKFGISPFGIWRPGHPSQITGLDAYDHLFADARKWLANGWLDYCAPQLYWAIQQSGQSYPVLLDWWARQNQRSRHIWPGNNSVQVGTKWKAEEIVNQIRITRKQPGATGNIHWNVSSLVDDERGLGKSLVKNVYTQPALVPASPWLDRQAPAKPKVTLQKGRPVDDIKVAWESGGTEKVWLWVVQSRTGKTWTTQVLPAGSRSQVLSRRKAIPDFIAVSGVDRCGNRSAPMVVSVKTPASSVAQNDGKSVEKAPEIAVKTQNPGPASTALR